MIKEIKKKIKSTSGESIGESLVALLISALAIVMLAGALTSAASIIRKSKDKLTGDDGYYAKMEELVKMESDSGDQLVRKSGSVKISGTGLEQSVDVYYKADKFIGDIQVIAYKIDWIRYHN